MQAKRGNVSYCFMLSSVGDDNSVGCAGSMATLPFSLMLRRLRERTASAISKGRRSCR
jgi:hypothetical protein